jgi:hypothetical protein
MASGVSFGRGNATKMKQPSSRCRKHFDLPSPGSGRLDFMMYMLHYYRETAHAALPYFKGRPVTLRFFPEGVLGESYYLLEGALNARTAFFL